MNSIDIIPYKKVYMRHALLWPLAQYGLKERRPFVSVWLAAFESSGEHISD